MLSEQIMRSSSFSRVIVSVSTVAIFAIAAYSWAVSPHTAYLHATEKYQTMTDSVEKKTLLLARAVSTKERKLQSLKQELMESRKTFFNSSEGVEFFSDLESVAEQNACNIKLMTFKPARSVKVDEQDMDSAMITVRNAALRYTGKYGQVTRFLRYLNDHPKRICVSGLQIKSPPGGGTILECRMNITIYITENKESETDEKD